MPLSVSETAGREVEGDFQSRNGYMILVNRNGAFEDRHPLRTDSHMVAACGVWFSGLSYVVWFNLIHTYVGGLEGDLRCKFPHVM